MPGEHPSSYDSQAMGAVSGTTPDRPAPQAALSVEISRLVSRLLKGEAFDIAASGDDLAFRFPDAGMTGAMIAEAIERATATVGLIRKGAQPQPAAATEPASLIGDQLAAAIDAEIGELVAGQEAKAAPASDDEAAAEPDAEEPGKAADKEPRAFTTRGAMAAVRRAFFRG